MAQALKALGNEYVPAGMVFRFANNGCQFPSKVLALVTLGLASYVGTVSPFGCYCIEMAKELVVPY